MIRADVDDNLWLVDDMANTVTKCDRSGQRLLVLRRRCPVPGRVCPDGAACARLPRPCVLAAAAQR